MLSAEVNAAFEYEAAVFDAGGDPVGAAALGGLPQKFQAVREEYHALLRGKRAQAPAAQRRRIIEMMEQISARIRLSIDGIINKYEPWTGKQRCRFTGWAGCL